MNSLDAEAKELLEQEQAPAAAAAAEEGRCCEAAVKPNRLRTTNGNNNGGGKAPVSPSPSPGPVYPSNSGGSVGDYSAVLGYAMSRIGCPYVWGAEGPDSFDCSGLVTWAYRQVGKYVPHQSEAQYRARPAWCRCPRLVRATCCGVTATWASRATAAARITCCPTQGAYVRDPPPVVVAVHQRAAVLGSIRMKREGFGPPLVFGDVEGQGGALCASRWSLRTGCCRTASASTLPPSTRSTAMRALVSHRDRGRARRRAHARARARRLRRGARGRILLDTLACVQFPGRHAAHPRERERVGGGACVQGSNSDWSPLAGSHTDPRIVRRYAGPCPAGCSPRLHLARVCARLRARPCRGLLPQRVPSRHPRPRAGQGDARAAEPRVAGTEGEDEAMEPEVVSHRIAPVFGRALARARAGNHALPGLARRGFYYGHPQNRFWKVLGALFDEPEPLGTDVARRFCSRTASRCGTCSRLARSSARRMRASPVPCRTTFALSPTRRASRPCSPRARRRPPSTAACAQACCPTRASAAALHQSGERPHAPRRPRGGLPPLKEAIWGLQVEKRRSDEDTPGGV